MTVQRVEGRIINSANETKLTDSEGRKEVSDMVKNWGQSSYTDPVVGEKWKGVFQNVACTDCPTHCERGECRWLCGRKP